MTVTKANIAASLLDPNLQKVLGGLVDDVNQLVDDTTPVGSIATTATPATGTCAAQFVFKDLDGNALTAPITGSAYFSNSTGLAYASVTSAAVLTNGAWRDTVAGYIGRFITTAAGLLGVTVTAAAGTYYLSFELPNGKIITSTALTVN